jgi:hypothetical protein
MKLFLSIALTILTTFTVQAKKYDISLNLEEGKTYTLNSKSSLIVTQSYKGNEMKITMNLDFGIDYTVKTAGNNEFVLDVKYTDLGMLMDMPQGKLDYSSGKEVSDTLNDLMSIMFDNMVGKSFEMTLDNKGKVKSVSGFDKIIAHLFDNLPSSIDMQKDQLMGQMNNAFGEDSFKQNMEAATAIFPDKPVKVGDTWEIETTINSTIEFNIKNVYTLEKVTKEFYLVKAIGSIGTAQSLEFMERNGVFVKQELSGASESEISLNKKTGWIQLSEVKQDINGTTYMKQTEDGEVMEMPIKLDGVTTITNVK